MPCWLRAACRSWRLSCCRLSKTVPPTSGTNTPTQAISVAMGPARISSFRFVPRPVVNISSTTPISAKMEMESLVCTKFSRHGPMSRPAMISPTTCGALHLRATSAKNLALRIMIARSRKMEYMKYPLLLSG